MMTTAATKCAACGETWPCSDSRRRDLPGLVRALHGRVVAAAVADCDACGYPLTGYGRCACPACFDCGASTYETCRCGDEPCDDLGVR